MDQVTFRVIEATIKAQAAAKMIEQAQKQMEEAQAEFSRMMQEQEDEYQAMSNGQASGAEGSKARQRIMAFDTARQKMDNVINRMKIIKTDGAVEAMKKAI